MSPIQNLRRSLIRNWRPICSVIGDAVLGAEPPLSPPPCLLPPASGGAGPVHSSSVDLLRPFVLRMAGSVFSQLIFSHSFAIPQFKLLSHRSSLRLPSGHSGPVLTISTAAQSSPFCPHLGVDPLVADAGVWGTFLLGVAFRHVSVGFVCLFVCLFSSQLGCPLRFENFLQTRQCEGFLVFGNFLY